MSEIHIVAMAARTPVGLDAEPTAAAIRAGISRIGAHPFMVDADSEPLVCAYDATLDPALFGSARLAELARSTLAQAALKVAGAHHATIPALLALPEERPGFGEQHAAELIRELSRTPAGDGPRLEVRGVGRGHAGACQGFEQAVALLGGGQAEPAIVAGVDGYLDADAIDWLDRDLRLARARRRGGFPPGEAAAALVLATDAARRRQNLPSLAVVRAVACAHEARDETSPAGLLGEALTDVYRRAAAQLNRPSERFDDLYCDINDERPRTTDLGFALLRVGDTFRDGTAYRTPVASIGDVGAATLPLNCILAAWAWARAHAAGSVALVSGASWGGLRGAVLLTQPGES